jgi:tetratricopeptide (TPR) repeat protein
VRGLSAGLGAGLAGSMNHGAVVRNSYEAIMHAQQVAAAETKAINDYLALGNKFEKAKEWFYAEQSFAYVLKLIAHQDGPGSKRSVAVLEHLSQACKKQGKLDQAIGYQKTLVALKDKAKDPDPDGAFKATHELSQLYLEKKDLANAQRNLQQETSLFNKYPQLPRAQFATTLAVYGKVLREMHQDAEAARVEAMVAMPQTWTAQSSGPGALPAQVALLPPGGSSPAAADSSNSASAAPVSIPFAVSGVPVPALAISSAGRSSAAVPPAAPPAVLEEPEA